MFGFENNSIEPVGPVRPSANRRQDRDEIPVREATPAEMRSLKSRAAPHSAETDDVARRHNLYTHDRRTTRIYYTDYQQKSEVMRAGSDRISTKLDDRQTVSAMLDLAEARGWQTIKVRGTESFRREAWVQAKVRGMEAEGYQPKPTDVQEAERRENAVKAVKVAPPAEATQPVAQSAKAPAEAPKQEKPKAAARQTAKAKATEKPAEKQTGAPRAAPSTQQARDVAKAAVWGAVEAAGQQARQTDAAKAAETQKQAPTASKPAARSVPIAVAAE